jgi:hypothetical protein
MGAITIGLALAIVCGRGEVLAGDLFSVSGVRVDATAESAQAAQRTALKRGQIAALRLMFQKLTLVADHPRLPSVDSAMIDRLMRSYEVNSERRSAERYVAEISVFFDPDGVRSVIRQAGVPYAETVSPTSLLLPVFIDDAGTRLWESPNEWRMAWEKFSRGGRLVDMILPYGELADLAAVSADQALAGDPVALAAISARYDVGDVVVAIAQSMGQTQVAIEIRRHAEASEVLLRGNRTLLLTAPDEADLAGSLETGTAEEVAMAARISAYGVVIADVVAVLEQAWIAENLLDYQTVTGLPVEVPLHGLSQWIDVRQRLEALSQIDRVDIDSLSPVSASLTLHFLGTEDRLASALQRRKLSLIEDLDGNFTVTDLAALPVQPEIDEMDLLLERTALGEDGVGDPSLIDIDPNGPASLEPTSREADVPFEDDLLVE